MPYQRIVIKLSGEALKSSQNIGIQQKTLKHYTEEIKAAYQSGVQLALVIGGGNFWRGNQGAPLGIHTTSAHTMGMLATLMNAIALRDLLQQQKIPTQLMSAFPIPTLCHPYDPTEARKTLEKRTIVLLAGGLGTPFFSTDTAAITAALSLDADILLKGTKVEGVYPKDPQEHPQSKPYTTLTLSDAYTQQLRIMDMTAIALAQEHNFPIIIYNAQKKGYLTRILQGEALGTKLH